MIPTWWHARSAGAHAQHDVGDVVDRQRLRGGFQERAEAPAAQELHHHVRRAVLREAEIQNLHDVAMVDAWTRPAPRA